jgi:hypothetical protein
MNHSRLLIRNGQFLLILNHVKQHFIHVLGRKALAILGSSSSGRNGCCWCHNNALGLRLLFAFLPTIVLVVVAHHYIIFVVNGRHRSMMIAAGSGSSGWRTWRRRRLRRCLGQIGDGGSSRGFAIVRRGIIIIIIIVVVVGNLLDTLERRWLGFLGRTSCR